MVGAERFLDAVEPSKKLFLFLENISEDILIPNFDFIGEILKGKSDILWVRFLRVFDDFRE